MSASVTQSIITAGNCKSPIARPRTLRFHEEQLCRFFEQSPDLLCIVGFDGFFQVLNCAWENVLGFSKEILLQTPWRELVHPEDLPSTLAQAERIMTSGKNLSFENRCRCKDGSYRWLQWNATAVPDQGLIYASARDISEHKESEAVLRHSSCELEMRVEERTIELANSNAILLAEIDHCRRIERSLFEAQEKYRSIFDNAVEGIFQSTPDGTYISVNPALARIKGYDSPEELIAAIGDIGHQSYVDPNRRVEFKSLIERSGMVNAFEYEIYRKDGEKVWLSMNARAVRNSKGEVVYYEGTIQDISEKKRLEEQLTLAQKMEAVGQLAGGIAHDFNNLLSVIIGYAELLLDKLDEESPLRRHAQQISSASVSAASLVEQLLAFSRKQMLQPVILDLNSVVTNVAKMLERVVGENITLDIALGEELGNIKADRTQIEQVIVNLVVNARDAMPTGGKLCIETCNVSVDGARTLQPGDPLIGSFVALTVADSGIGMDRETQSHIFEPFFTTKVRGKGTGLGLATVYGVVKQSGGSISVQSAPGHGTTFRILFPRVTESITEVEQAERYELPCEGTETILLVEDDAALRELVLGYLMKYGYTVLEAANGAQAHSVARCFRGTIHLLLTDVIMPGPSGPQVAKELATFRPDMQVLYMSGYAECPEESQIRHQGDFLVQKPFTPHSLVRKIREMLDRRAS